MAGPVVAAILGGGHGSRLFPLTLLRAKPAVPLAGKYRLIDIPVSNCINSGYVQIFVLTQFNSASLNRHINRTFRFDRFSPGFVEVLAAEQSGDSGDWYQGTADAIRKQFNHFDRRGVKHVIILSGDHLYRMDYRKLIERHVESGADVTVSTVPANRQECTGFGIVSVDELGYVRGFVEKPGPDDDISPYAVPIQLRKAWGVTDRPYLASMGVYVFRLDALRSGLENESAVDFGRDVLPAMVNTHRFAAFRFDGYWEDIGTVDAFFRANIALCEDSPAFSFWDVDAPIYHRPRVLPPSSVTESTLTKCIVAGGATIRGAELERCIVGLRSVIGEGVRAKRCVLMGADFFAAPSDSDDRPAVGIGPGCRLEDVIVDKNASIGAGSTLIGRPDRPDEDGDGWAVRDGIVIVTKNAVIPPGSEL